MAFETVEQRAAREKAEAAAREANIRRYEQKMGVQLPYSPVAVIERKADVPVESSGMVPAKKTTGKSDKATRRNRGAYMKAFRKRPVVCPACGHNFTELKRAAAPSGV